MKYLVTILLVLATVSVRAQTYNPYLSLKYDKVIMYDYEEAITESDVTIINSKGKLSKHIKKQVILDNTTIQSINKRIGLRSSYGGGTRDCFVPHLGVVYYLNNEVVAHFSVCLLCNRLKSNIRILAQERVKYGKEENERYVLDGLSDGFSNFIRTLAKKYKFSHTK